MIIARTTSRRSKRRGFSMVEVIISGVLIGAVIATAVPMLRNISLQQRAANRQQIALAEASNILDSLTSRPWADITSESAGALSLSADANRQLPAAKLQINVASEAARPEQKKVTLSLRWENELGASAAPVRLTTWVFQRGRREP